MGEGKKILKKEKIKMKKTIKNMIFVAVTVITLGVSFASLSSNAVAAEDPNNPINSFPQWGGSRTCVGFGTGCEKPL